MFSDGNAWVGKAGFFVCFLLLFFCKSVGSFFFFSSPLFVDHSRLTLARALPKLQAELASVHVLASSSPQLWFSLWIVSGPGLVLEINAPNIPSWNISCSCPRPSCGHVSKNMAVSASRNTVALLIETF